MANLIFPEKYDILDGFKEMLIPICSDVDKVLYVVNSIALQSYHMGVTSHGKPKRRKPAFLEEDLLEDLVNCKNKKNAVTANLNRIGNRLEKCRKEKLQANQEIKALKKEIKKLQVIVNDSIYF